MLVLTINSGDFVQLDLDFEPQLPKSLLISHSGSIKVFVLDTRSDHVRLGFEAPPNVRIRRSSLVRQDHNLVRRNNDEIRQTQIAP